jgi:hypothetical protein
VLQASQPRLDLDRSKWPFRNDIAAKSGKRVVRERPRGDRQ